jgi:hypothetical protein
MSKKKQQQPEKRNDAYANLMAGKSVNLGDFFAATGRRIAEAKKKQSIKKGSNHE